MEWNIWESYPSLRVEREGVVKSWRDLSHELFPDSVFQKLLRINLDDAHQRRLHGQQALREDGDVVGQLGNLAKD